MSESIKKCPQCGQEMEETTRMNSRVGCGNGGYNKIMKCRCGYEEIIPDNTYRGPRLRGVFC